jgi:hypothetical protein
VEVHSRRRHSIAPLLAKVAKRTKGDVSEISFLLSELENPFQMFPLREIAETLDRCIADSRTYLGERAGWYGVSPKYRTVDEEHTEDVIFNLIGSAFVLAQTSIVQAAAIATKLRDIAGKPSWMPDSKIGVMKVESTIHQITGLSEMVLFNAVANYFKHRHQWPSNWGQDQSAPRERQTIEIVVKLGLSPTAVNNLEIALRNLQLANLLALGESIQTWRERLAQHLRALLREHDLN